ncbi:MAG TPA: DUF2147 domain-containing protein [Hyphomicrobiaceae bacterium]|nr:DUF2147 domain-containing protein [Hyphomicrobiaceae bacterium]
MRFSLRLGAGIAALTGFATAAMAVEPTGNWVRPSSGTVINFYACGANLCAKIVSVKDASKKGTVGTVIMNGAVKSGANVWKGSLLNTEDGQTYTGSVTLSGSGLVLSGCVLGGLICKNETLQRVK